MQSPPLFPLLNDFNPRSPQGERLARYTVIYEGIQFQSTLPAGGATRGTRAGR